jgi:hypothetical protein
VLTTQGHTGDHPHGPRNLLPAQNKVHVETGSSDGLDEQTPRTLVFVPWPRHGLTQHLRLARRMGRMTTSLCRFHIRIAGKVPSYRKSVFISSIRVRRRFLLGVLWLSGHLLHHHHVTSHNLRHPHVTLTCRRLRPHHSCPTRSVMVHIFIKGGVSVPSILQFSRSQLLIHVIQVYGSVRSKFILLLTSPTSQNTEDEVLKAAIAKYGRNQW